MVHAKEVLVRSGRPHGPRQWRGEAVLPGGVSLLGPWSGSREEAVRSVKEACACASFGADPASARALAVYSDKDATKDDYEEALEDISGLAVMSLLSEAGERALARARKALKEGTTKGDLKKALQALAGK